MSKSKVFIALLLVIQLAQMVSGQGFYFNPTQSQAYLAAGNCYLYPGLSGSGASSNVGYLYYNLPYGWRQYQNKVVIPNLISTQGSYSFGAKAVSGNNQINQQFKVRLNGLQIQLAPSSSSSWTNLVIGNNYRTPTVSDKDWSDFLASISRGDGWVSGGSSSSYWFPSGSSGSSSSFSSSSSSSSSSYTSGSNRPSSTGLDNLYGGYGDDSAVRTGIIFGTSVTTPSQIDQSRSATSDDMRAALDQQYNANKQLNDLNTLIGQLTANVNSVAPTVKKIQSDIADLRSQSSTCNNKILELSNNKLRAETAVRDITDQINVARTRISQFTPAINSLVNSRNQLVQTRDNIERSNNPKSSLLTQLTSRYSGCNSQIDILRSDYTRAQSSIESNNNQIRTIQNSVSDAPNQINLANQQLRVVDSTIADLQSKLSEARAQRSKIQGDIVNYNNVVSSSNNQIATLRAQNDRVNGQLSSIQSNIDSQVIQCSSTQRQIDDIRSEIARGQKDYDDLVKQIQVQDNLIAAKKNQIDRFQSETSSLPMRLSSVQADLDSAQTAVSRQYFICNQANSAVANVENDLRAAQLRYDTENKFLTDAQAKLSTYTSQKQAADDRVNKLLNDANRYVTSPSSSTTVVSVRPSGGISGLASPSSPSSSSLNTFNLFSATPVGDFSTYATRVYGTGVSSYLSSLGRSISPQATMYPVSETTYNALLGRSNAGIFLPSSSSSLLSGINYSQIGSSAVPSNIVSDFTCSSTGSDISGYGTVSSVQPGYITVNSSSGPVNLRIGSCSRLEAVRPEAVVATYDRVFYRGKKSLSNVHLYDLTCL